MKYSVLFVALVALLSVVCARQQNDVAPTQAHSSGSPSSLFAWSSKGMLSGQDVDVPKVVSPWDVTAMLSYFLRTSEHATFPHSLSHVAPSKEGRPEIALLMLPKELRSDRVSSLVGGYTADSKLGGSLSGIMGWIKNAEHSFVASSLSQKDSSVKTAVQNFVRYTAPNTGAQIFVAHPDSAAAGSLDISGATRVPLSELKHHLESSGAAVNGKTDLVLLELNDASSESAESMSAADGMMDQATKLVKEATKDNYVAIVAPMSAPSTGVQLGEKEVKNAPVFHGRTMATDNSGAVSEGQIYLTSSILQALLTALLLLVIACCGICCLARVQTPSQFEDPRTAKKHT